MAAYDTGKTPGLYGLKHSNRNYSDPYYWGKNQFNSSFPAALCCYMRDSGKGAIQISAKGPDTVIGLHDFSEIFGTTLKNENIKFLFEEVFDKYAKYVVDPMEKIDLVISNAVTGEMIRPLEIKLTTLPDDGTSTLSDEEYGSEIVVRSATIKYLVLGIVDSMSDTDRKKILGFLDPVCKKIRDWRNLTEMRANRDIIIGALDSALQATDALQKPLLVQPVWKTVGKSPQLAENCLDVFVWTDYALMRLILSAWEPGKNLNKITRPQRSALRIARFLWELCKQGDVYQAPIFEMLFDTQSDKEFAFRGAQTNRFMACMRLTHPIVTKSEIKKIILGGGQKMLSPERRFDAILYFSTDLFEEE